MTRQIKARPLTPSEFSHFGVVLECDGAPDKLINAGQCGRVHDLAALDFVPGGRAGISLFDAVPRSFPYTLDLLERHPEGSQAFLPMTQNPFLVIVAPDEGGRPGTPLAFLTRPGQGVNYARGCWHGVLAPIHAPGLFAVVDRIGETPNLEEFALDPPYIVVP